MPELAGALRRLGTSWPGDALLAAALVAWSAGFLLVAPAAASTGPARPGWATLVFVLPSSAAIAVRRRWPLAAAAVTCVALLSTGPLHLTAADGALGIPFAVTPFLIAYTLGTSSGLAAGCAGVIVLVAGLQIGSRFNPVYEMVTLGGWLAGRVVLSRRDLAGRLQARNEELLAEQELFAEESVRYERARIARELHDIVAHCLSVLVIQASAGQHLADSDPAGATEALESVAEAAAEARAEIGRLAELLSGPQPADAPPRLEMIDELVQRASGAGLAVTCRLQASWDGLAPAAAEAAYRLVQESLTNALKHAPGAPVSVTVARQDHSVAVTVANAAPRQPPTGLERSGSGHGLTGMRERVTACGGSMTAGPSPAGGWQVRALFPETVRRPS
jgi:signal transduction histidine kinase